MIKIRNGMFSKAIITITLGCCISCVSTPSSSLKNPAPLSNTIRLGVSHPPSDQVLPDGKTRGFEFSRRALADLNVQNVTFSEFWEFREPIPGDFHWKTLDAKIEFISKSGLSLFLIIDGKGPAWACSPTPPPTDHYCALRDMNDFEHYLRALLSRYPNQIAKIAFANEWDSGSLSGFDAEEFLARETVLARTVREMAPNTLVLLGSISTNFMNYFAACSGKISSFNDTSKIEGAAITEYCGSRKWKLRLEKVRRVVNAAQSDYVDLHFYDDAENWPLYLSLMRELGVNKPVIVSEFGGPNVLIEPYSPEYHATRLRLYLHTLNDMGIREAYHFKLVEVGDFWPTHIHSALFDGSYAKKPKVYDTFSEFSHNIP